MKNVRSLFALILCAGLLLCTFAGCNAKEQDTVFVKPKSYASVVTVTINPQFRLYLDVQNKVLAVEPVNADAKSIQKEVTAVGQSVDAAVSQLVILSQDNGFVKADAVINVVVSEVVDTAVDTTALLAQTQTTVKQTLQEIKVEATVNVTVADGAVSSQTLVSSQEVSLQQVSSQETVSDNVSSKVTSSKVTSSKVTSSKESSSQQASSQPASSAPVKRYSMNPITHAGVTSVARNAILHDNGTVDFDIMLCAAWRSNDLLEYVTDEYGFEYTIPEDIILRNLRKKFVITDAQFSELKAQGTYEFTEMEHTYSNGYFHLIDPALGGPPDYLHNIVAYEDDKKGTLTLYYDYTTSGIDTGEDPEHLYYYSVTYTYTGSSDLTVYFDKEKNYPQIDSTSQDLLDSLRIKSMQKIANIDGKTKVEE